MKLAYARLVTKDVPALAAFYSNITGIAPAGNEDYVELRTAAGTLALCSERVMQLHNASAGVAGANRSAIIEFQVDDVDCERARLAGSIAEFVLEPTTQPWRNRSMLFRDPDGNLINFFAPVAAAAAQASAK